MSMRTHLIGPLDLFVEQLEGELVFEDARDMKQTELDLLPPGADARVLCVVSAVTYQIDDVRAYLRWLGGRTRLRSVPTACVVAEPMGAALVLLLRQWSDGRPIEIFSTLEPALRWLGVEPDLDAADLGIDLMRPNGHWRSAAEFPFREHGRRRAMPGTRP